MHSYDAYILASQIHKHNNSQPISSAHTQKLSHVFANHNPLLANSHPKVGDPVPIQHRKSDHPQIPRTNRIRTSLSLSPPTFAPGFRRQSCSCNALLSLRLAAPPSLRPLPAASPLPLLAVCLLSFCDPPSGVVLDVVLGFWRRLRLGRDMRIARGA